MIDSMMKVLELEVEVYADPNATERERLMLAAINYLLKEHVIETQSRQIKPDSRWFKADS